jgi:hypothetical protein
MALQRIARVEALRAVAGPQRLHRLARLIDREGRVRAEAQLGLQVRASRRAPRFASNAIADWRSR